MYTYYTVHKAEVRVNGSLFLTYEQEMSETEETFTENVINNALMEVNQSQQVFPIKQMIEKKFSDNKEFCFAGHDNTVINIRFFTETRSLNRGMLIDLVHNTNQYYKDKHIAIELVFKVRGKEVVI